MKKPVVAAGAGRARQGRRPQLTFDSPVMLINRSIIPLFWILFTLMKKGRDILLLLILSTVIVYSNHFNNSFHFDDSHTIVNNLSIRELNIGKFFTDGSTFSSLPTNQSYRPVVTTLNAIDYSFGGTTTPFWFHVSIFLSFIAAGILLFFFVEHLLEKIQSSNYNTAIALFITGWFWLHPANAETINYIIARSDSFSTCMVLLAFVLYVKSGFANRTFLYLLPFSIGFLAKETAIIFLPLLFLYEWMFNQEGSFLHQFSAAIKKMIIPAILGIGLILLYQQMLPGSWQSGGDYNKTDYWLTQPFAILHYAGNFFVPLNLVADTDWQAVTAISDRRFYTGLFFLLFLLVVACIASIKRSLRLIGFGLLWFPFALLPTSLIPLAELINDHRTFFPYIGLFIACAGLLQWLLLKQNKILGNKNTGRLLQIVVIGFFAMLSFMTYQRNKVWRSENSLWKEVTEKAPNNGRGWMNYGLTQMAAGDYDGAETSYKKAMALLPGYSYIYVNLGILYDKKGLPVPAEDYFKTGLTFGGSSPEPYAWYADFLIRANRITEAKSIVSKGLAISPNHEMLNTLLATLNSSTPQPLNP